MVNLSARRQALPPSTFTSKEYKINLASLPNVLDTTPPAVPASSPAHRLNSQSLIAIILPPSALTVVLPLAKSLDLETITGYGIGTGPPGLGVLQTSGAVLIAMWLLAL